MALDKIGNSLYGDDADTWDAALATRDIVGAYNEDTGMNYRYHTESGILASWHDGVGLVTYFRITHEQWLTIIDGCSGE